MLNTFQKTIIFVSFRLKSKDFIHLQELITVSLPFETGKNLYNYNQKKYQRGKLYTQYIKGRAKLITAGIIKSIKSTGSDLEETLEMSDDSSEALSDDAAQKCAELKLITEPWEKIELLWRETFTIRNSQLRNQNIETYLGQFPFMQDFRSAQLLAEDGHKKMNQLGWNGSYTINRILNNFQKVLKNRITTIPKHSKPILNKLFDEDVKIETRSLFALSLLPFYVKAPMRKRDIEKDEYEDFPRERSYWNFLPIVESLAEAKEYSQKKQRKDLQCPFAYLILKNPKLNQLHLALQAGKVWWEFDDPVKGFDVFFKMFFALNVNYNPVACRVLWIVQNLIYGLKIKRTDTEYGCQATYELLKIFSG